jgi:alpha-amylase
MTADHPNAIGVGGTTANTYNKQYPGVPYGPNDFNPTCDIDYQNRDKVSDLGL